MERLWAPWRVAYIRNPGRGCFFCAGCKARNPAKSFILEKTEYAFSLLNRFPYNNGHIMIAPVRHIGSLEELDNEEILAINHLLTRAMKAIRDTMKAHGFNIGINQGNIAGAGVVDHIHVHCVPRWQGDTNFMPVLTDTKVVSEALHDTYAAIKKGLAAIDKLK